jgi:predicted Co/Zn/Cd cation transporter (cation efflux family)
MSRSLRYVKSPLVEADKANWMVNSVISAAVLTAFCLVMLFDALDWQRILPYVDPLLVVGVVLLCLGVPVRMATQALYELLNKTPPSALTGPIHQAIEQALAEVETDEVRVRMVRPGRMLYVMVHVVLPKDTPLSGVVSLDTLRTRLDEHIRQCYSPMVCDVVFTADKRWAAPSCGELVEKQH